MQIYLPKSFQLPDSLSDKKLADPAKYFIYLIYRSRLWKKFKKNDFVPLMKKSLKSQLGSDICNKIIEELTAAGLIEDDGFYIPREKSTGYRLIGGLQNEMFQRTTITNKSLIKRLQKWEELSDNRSVPQHLVRNLKQLTIAPEAAKYAKKLCKAILNGTRDRETRKKARRQLSSDLLSIDFIQKGEWFTHCCQYGRVHSNITNLSGRLRPLLRLDSQQLAEIDIANSQPLFLAILLRQNVYTERDIIESFPSFQEQVKELKARREKLEERTKEEEAPPSSHYGVNFHSGLKTRNYLQDVESGVFYSEVQKFLGLETLGEAKKAFFRLTYGKEQDNPLSRLYPEAIEFCSKVKAKDYRHLAHMLQRLESHVVIWDASFVLEEMKIWHATIHDSFLCKPEDVETVKKVVEGRICHLGASAAFKVTI